MEKNWIEETREFIHKAINKELKICCEKYDNKCYEFWIINHEEDKESVGLTFYIDRNKFHINTHRGFAIFNINFTKRDLLELDSLILSIEEYQHDMALTEFNDFFLEEEKSVNIDDLNDDD